jgi:hypothetical protein
VTYRRIALVKLPSDASQVLFAAQKTAAEELAQLTKKLSTLRLSLIAIPQQEAAVDGRRVDLAALEAGVELDPGEHTIVVMAPDHEPTSVRVTIAPGEKKTVAIAPKAAQKAPI